MSRAEIWESGARINSRSTVFRSSRTFPGQSSELNLSSASGVNVRGGIPSRADSVEAKYCAKVQVLERMATVSTSARLRLLQLELAQLLSLRLSEHLPEDVSERLPELMRDVIEEIGGTR